MKKEIILIPDALKDEELEQLKAVAIQSEFMVYQNRQDITEEDLKRATVIFGNVAPSQLQLAKNLKWIQTNSAGVDALCKPGILNEGALITNATGAYGMPISEYMVGTVLAFYKNLLKYKTRQPLAIWSNVGHIKYVQNTKVLCIGLGDIGASFAIRMKQLGAYTIGIKRTTINKPDYMDELYTTGELANVISQADIIALSLPKTPDTTHIINKKMLALMKADALIINVGRGDAIDTEALVKCLQTGKLMGAALDVFEKEPLPTDHPLWQMDNVLITPHVSGGNYDAETGDIVFNLMLDNFKRYFNNEPLKNPVDITTGYKQSNH